MMPLVVRSHFSLLQGTAPIKELVRAARGMGYRALALTDMDNLYGLWPFLKACRENDVRPIVGAQITAKESRALVVCLAKDAEGYANLCQLITARKMGGESSGRAHSIHSYRLRPSGETRTGVSAPPMRCTSFAGSGQESFDIASMVERFGKGLCVLTDDAQLLERWHTAGLDVSAAVRGITQKSADVRASAKRLGVPVAVVPDSFFLSPGGHRFHTLLRAIALNTTFSRLAADDIAPADAYLGPSEEYEKRFAILPEALKATHEIAERCVFTGPDTAVIFPPWEGEDACATLRALAYEGARERYGNISDAVKNRLEYELGIIAQKRFCAYFLVVRDIVRRSPRICGRGSGAASLVAYCLGITNVCPMKHNLYFERFLNPGRTDPPDIDVDFAWDERAEVIASVLRQYAGHSAMVCNHVFFQPRMAIRETAKVYGLSAREIAEVADRVPWYMDVDDGGLQAALSRVPRARFLEFGPPWPEILKLAGWLIGTPRNLSVHPGGVVITPGPIARHAPLELKLDGVPVIQWEKDGAEEAGLVKIDLLGNRSLGVIRDAIRNVRENNIAFDEAAWEPEDDPQTQAMVARGQTMGCFYIESPAMRLLQEKARQGDFEHLVIHSSIIRPAANEFIREYLRRLHGGAWEPLHPLLGEILDETFGIMVYQEDVSKVAVALAGFSHSEADCLRKIMSKKDKEMDLKNYRQKFFDGAAANGVSPETTEEIWRMILSFDGYSFCKPHSASYAKVSFQAAYLKAHFPAEFMAAVISNQGGFYSAFAYVSEARRLGCAVLPPDVNESEVRWKGRGRDIRVGLLSIKNLGNAAMERITAERHNGRYRSFGDFLARVRPAEDEARALVHCGAFASLEKGKSQADLLWELACWLKGEKEGSDLMGVAVSDSVITFPAEHPMETLRREYVVLGFLCGHHPIVFYADEAEKAGAVKARDIRQCVGKRARFAGWLITGKVVSTKHGEPMEFLTFEDDTGVLETVFFPQAYRKFCAILDSHKPYLLEGKVEEEFGAVTMSVSAVRAL